MYPNSRKASLLTKSMTFIACARKILSWTVLWTVTFKLDFTRHVEVKLPKTSNNLIISTRSIITITHLACQPPVHNTGDLPTQARTMPPASVEAVLIAKKAQRQPSVFIQRHHSCPTVSKKLSIITTLRTQSRPRGYSPLIRVRAQ